jgi:hypothetical protein
MCPSLSQATPQGLHRLSLASASLPITLIGFTSPVCCCPFLPMRTVTGKLFPETGRPRGTGPRGTICPDELDVCDCELPWKNCNVQRAFSDSLCQLLAYACRRDGPKSPNNLAATWPLGRELLTFNTRFNNHMHSNNYTFIKTWYSIIIFLSRNNVTQFNRPITVVTIFTRLKCYER